MSNEETVFGIDLGTTYSCIAYVDDYGRPVVVPNSDNQPTTPSVVEFQGAGTIVGEEAKKNAVISPNAVVEMVKRHMGELIGGQPWRFPYQGKDYTAEEISARILKKLTSDAEQSLGHPIKKVVITCPAYFGINEREATANAGKIAGLDVLEIINEPTAAAISYAMQQTDEAMRDQVALVYDLGGGTFDVTMIEIKSGAITVIATGGDHHLGGRDWDEKVVQYLGQEWMQQTGSYDDPADSPETRQDLWIRAEDGKKSLSNAARTETPVRVTHDGQAATITLSRDKFNELTQGLLDRTIALTRQTLDDARAKGYGHFDQLLLVGGSTMMPQVAERLRYEFSIEPKMFDPNQAVAKGAAMYGLKLAIGQKIEALESQGKSSAQAKQQAFEETGLHPQQAGVLADTIITNVISHSFGVVALNEQERQIISNLVIRQRSLPRTETEMFGTAEANQSRADIRVMENDQNDAEVFDLSVGREIGSTGLSLPPGLPKGSPIQVTFEINEQGRLEMTAVEMTTGKTVRATYETAAVMSAEQVAQAKADLQLVKVR